MRSKSIAAVLAATALLIGGCSASEGTSSGDGEVVTVLVKDMAYEPATVTISAGDTVEWVWDATLPHDVVADDESPMPFNSELITEGSFSQTFDEVGVYPYHCTPHPQMVGEVIVE